MTNDQPDQPEVKRAPSDALAYTIEDAKRWASENTEDLDRNRLRCDDVHVQSPELEFWAVVEVMGHARYAGRVSEYAALGLPLIRVEIPTTDDAKPAEILLGQSAIFRITPCTERAARVAARQFHVRPLAMVDLRMGTLETAPPRWLTQRDHEDDDDPDDHPDDHPMYD